MHLQEKQEKKVALIVPVYNVQEYLKECLDSLVNQTYKNLEILIINDGSLDASLKISKAYAQKDPRIKIFDVPNSGLARVRNVALEFLNKELKYQNNGQEEGLYIYEGKDSFLKAIYTQDPALSPPAVDYIQFIDSDDYIDLCCVELCVDRMQGVDIVWIDTEIFFDRIRKRPWISPMKWLGYTKEQILSKDDFLSRIAHTRQYFFHFSASSGGMISRSFLQEIKLKYVNGIVQEDDCFGILLFAQARRIYVFPKELYHYRIRSGSIMNYANTISKDNIPIFFRHFLKDFMQDASMTKSYLHLSSLARTSLELINFLNTCKDPYTKAVVSKYLLPTYINKSLNILNIPKDPLNLIPQMQSFTPFLEQMPKVGIRDRIYEQTSYKIGSYLLGLKNIKSILEAPKILHVMLKNHKEAQKVYKQRAKLYAFARLPKYEEYEDFRDLVKVQKHLSYKLGTALTKASEKWYLGAYFLLPFQLLYIVITWKKGK